MSIQALRDLRGSKCVNWRDDHSYVVMPRRPASTTHMRYPPSSGNLPILPNTLSIHPRPYPVVTAARVCVKDMSAACLGGVAGVKSRSPPKRVREAQDLRPASSPKHNGACRSAAVGPTPACRSAHPSSRSTSQPLRHVASCHINSYPVAARSSRTRNPHTWGIGLGNRDHSLASACCSPSWIRSRALDFGELIRPDRTSSSLLPHAAMSLHHLLIPPRRRLAHPRRRQTQSAFSTAPSGTTPSVT